MEEYDVVEGVDESESDSEGAPVLRKDAVIITDEQRDLIERRKIEALERKKRAEEARKSTVSTLPVSDDVTADYNFPVVEDGSAERSCDDVAEAETELQIQNYRTTAKVPEDAHELMNDFGATENFTFVEDDIGLQ